MNEWLLMHASTSGMKRKLLYISFIGPCPTANVSKCRAQEAGWGSTCMVAVEATELPGELQVKAVMGDTGSSMHRISRRCCSTCSRAFSMRLIRLRAVTSQAKANLSLPHTASLESRRISEYHVLLPATLHSTVTTQSQHSHQTHTAETAVTADVT